MKSIRETATEIAAQFAKPTERFQLADAIEQALRDRDERAARIAEAHFEHSGYQLHGPNHEDCRHMIPIEIRKED